MHFAGGQWHNLEGEVKTIPLRESEQIKSRDVIATIVSDGSRGIGVDEMRKRCRILDVLDKANGELKLEDADHEVLKRIVNDYPNFGSANPKLLEIIDDILDAKDAA